MAPTTIEMALNIDANCGYMFDLWFRGPIFVEHPAVLFAVGCPNVAVDCSAALLVVSPEPAWC